MIGWFRKWWPWGRKADSVTQWAVVVDAADAEASAWILRRQGLTVRLMECQRLYTAAIKAKKKRSHIEARMKEIRTELLRMEAGK